MGTSAFKGILLVKFSRLVIQFINTFHKFFFFCYDSNQLVLFNCIVSYNSFSLQLYIRQNLTSKEKKCSKFLASSRTKVAWVPVDV